ncbi:MAG: pyridoxal-phosphate dependent enzyme [Minisyncoccia bacterium]
MRSRLVRTYALPPELNPFIWSGVVLKLLVAFGESPYHKWHMAREGILDGIRRGFIDPDTTIVEASSGNTAHAMAVLCNALGLKFVPVIPNDIPSPKLDLIRSIGGGVSPLMFSSKTETTVERARHLGKQDRWYNPDQYMGEWNARAHEKFLAPEIFGQTPQFSLIFAPAGTFGTCLGIHQYAQEKGKDVRVVPVLCAEDQEVPAVRTLSRVKRDVRTGWENVFDEKDLVFADRHESFLESFRAWKHLPVQIGPSSGLALAGAMKFLQRGMEAGTLDSFKKDDGKVHVGVLCPDGYGSYADIYLRELSQSELSR